METVGLECRGSLQTGRLVSASAQTARRGGWPAASCPPPAGASAAPGTGGGGGSEQRAWSCARELSVPWSLEEVTQAQPHTSASHTELAQAGSARSCDRGSACPEDTGSEFSWSSRSQVEGPGTGLSARLAGGSGPEKRPRGHSPRPYIQPAAPQTNSISAVAGVLRHGPLKSPGKNVLEPRALRLFLLASLLPFQEKLGSF